MTVTWFVGNGFDLSVGFKTDFDTFVRTYLHGSIPGWSPAGRSRQEKRAIRKGKSMIRRHMRKKVINWSDMELALGQCTEYYTDTDKSRAEFTALRHDLEDSLSQYLRVTTRMGEKDWIRPEHSREIASAFRRALEKPPQGLENSARETVHKLWNLHSAGPLTCNFVNFNFTDVFDRCLQAYQPLSGKPSADGGGRPAVTVRKVFHAHGTVDRAKVLGVGNYFQIANKALQRGTFADGFVKMALYKGIEPNAYLEVKAMLDSSSLLIVTGMSLGKTDSHWWDLVANWLAEQPDRLVVIHWYRPGMELGRGETRIRERNKVDALLCDAIGCGRYPLLVHRFLVTYNEPVFGLRLVPPLPESRLTRAKNWLLAHARRLTGARRAA